MGCLSVSVSVFFAIVSSLYMWQLPAYDSTFGILLALPRHPRNFALFDCDDRCYSTEIRICKDDTVSIDTCSLDTRRMMFLFEMIWRCVQGRVGNGQGFEGLE